VLLVDGIWLHKPELRDAFDLTIWLEVDRSVALERAIARDRAWTDDPEGRYATRYSPGETRYLTEVAPAALADLVVENTDPAHPRLLLDSSP
jgi:uridine kinase